MNVCLASDSVTVLAVEAFRRLHGGTQSQLMLCSDRRLWVVKFQNNPQHIRVLANELIASGLAKAVGLTVPDTTIVDVPEELISSDPNMYIELPKGRKELYVHGKQFGSCYVGGLMPGQVVEYLPDKQVMEIRNITEFAGMLVFDKWTANCDGRQAVYHRSSLQQIYTATFIDQGFCFNAGEWNFPDSPLRGVHRRRRVYAGITGWTSFEPWLSRIESLDPEVIRHIALMVPPVWYGDDAVALDRLTRQLIERRGRVRDLVEAFRDSERATFPLW